MGIQLDDQEKAKLKRDGFVLKVDHTSTRRSYYKPDGTELPNLPADANSMKSYLARGFLLSPPEHPPYARRGRGRPKGSKNKTPVTGGN